MFRVRRVESGGVEYRVSRFRALSFIRFEVLVATLILFNVCCDRMLIPESRSAYLGRPQGLGIWV